MIDILIEVSEYIQLGLLFTILVILFRALYLEWRWNRGEELKDGKWQKDFFHRGTMKIYND